MILLLIGSAMAPRVADAESPGWVCVDDTWGGIACASPEISEAIFSAADYYDVDVWWLMRTAACESSFDPNTVGAMGEIGLFQWFVDWPYEGEFYEYGSGSPWDVWDASYAAANAFSQGHWWRFVCASR